MFALPEYSVHRPACPVPCSYCRQSFLPKDLAHHFRDHTGDDDVCGSLPTAIPLAPLDISAQDIFGSQSLFLRAILQQVWRGSCRSDLLSLFASWKYPIETVEYLIVHSELVDDHGLRLKSLQSAQTLGPEHAHETLAVALLLADLYLGLGRQADAIVSLTSARCSLRASVDVDRINVALDDLYVPSPVPTALIMLPHMAVLPSERRRLMRFYPPSEYPTDDIVRHYRDPLDGIYIGRSLQTVTVQMLHSMRLGVRPVFETDGDYLHATVEQFDDFGYSFSVVGGLSFRIHCQSASVFDSRLEPQHRAGHTAADPFNADEELFPCVSESQAATIAKAFPWVQSVTCTRTEIWLGVVPDVLVHSFQYPHRIAGLRVRLEAEEPLSHGALHQASFVSAHNRWPHLSPGAVVRSSRFCRPAASSGIMCSWNGAQYLTVPTHILYESFPYLSRWKAYLKRLKFLVTLPTQRASRLIGTKVYHCVETQEFGTVAQVFDDVSRVFNGIDCIANRFDVSLLTVSKDVIYSNVVIGMHSRKDEHLRRDNIFFARFDACPVGKLLALEYVGKFQVPGHPVTFRFHVKRCIPPGILDALLLEGICGTPIYNAGLKLVGFARFISNKQRYVSCVPLPEGLAVP
ncbi:C2H2-type domain-containing protein [Plasmodiophora brassicae]